MHRNTVLVTAILSVIAALLVGLNVGKKLATTNNTTPQITVNPSPQQNIVLTPSIVPTPTNEATNSGQISGAVSMKTYSSKYCKITYQYPQNFTLTESSNAARLKDPATDENMDMICGNNIPKPPIDLDQTESTSVSGIQAKIYHDNSAGNNQPIDVIIFTNPQNQLDIVFMGFGNTFQKLLKSVKLVN